MKCKQCNLNLDENMKTIKRKLVYKKGYKLILPDTQLITYKLNRAWNIITFLKRRPNMVVSTRTRTYHLKAKRNLYSLTYKCKFCGHEGLISIPEVQILYEYDFDLKRLEYYNINNKKYFECCGWEVIDTSYSNNCNYMGILDYIKLIIKR
jgi:hypothetical protein